MGKKLRENLTLMYDLAPQCMPEIKVRGQLTQKLEPGQTDKQRDSWTDITHCIPFPDNVVGSYSVTIPNITHSFCI